MRTMKLNDRGNDVANLQRVLQAMGIDIDPDGYYGPKTTAWVRYFQRTNGLVADGIAGPKTIERIDEVFEPSRNNFTSSAEVGADPFTEVDLGNLDSQDLVKRFKRLKGVHPRLQQIGANVVDAAAAEGIDLLITQGLRTFAYQDGLYAQGRTKPGKIVTSARAGQSRHNYGGAIDFARRLNGKITWDGKYYKVIGRLAKAEGLIWGGDWNFVDLPHVELAGLPDSYKDMLKVYNANGKETGGIEAVWSKYMD